jgi:hypothetical protein
MACPLQRSGTLQRDCVPCPDVVRSILLLLCLSVVLTGCSARERPARPLPELLQLRQTTATRLADDSQTVLGRVLTREKAQHDAYQAGRLSTPPHNRYPRRLGGRRLGRVWSGCPERLGACAARTPGAPPV